MSLTDYAKRAIASWMLERGHSFLKSAILLKRAEGSKDVELYNVCQGIEVTLKGLLLLSEYDKFNPLLKRTYGHRLVKLGNAVISEYGIKPLSEKESEELVKLDNYYRRNYLRYAGIHDIFLPSGKLEYNHLLKKLVAAYRMIDRELNK